MKNIFKFPFLIDVELMIFEVLEHPLAWKVDQERQRKLQDQRNTESIILRNSRIKRGISFNDISETFETVMFPVFPKVTEFLSWFIDSFGGEIGRASIVKLPPGKDVSKHIDEGKYYQDRDRFHLCLQGTYQYTVDNETEVLVPGTLMWFDSQKLHKSANIGNEDRIVVIFDVKNSQFREKYNF